MKFFALISLFLICSCNSDGEPETFKRSLDQYDQYISQKNAPSGSPDLENDTKISNSTYKMDLYLYKDGKFHYDMENDWGIIDGNGTWKYDGGSLKLLAKEAKYDLLMIVQTDNAEGSKISVQFRDREGRKKLNLIKD